MRPRANQVFPLEIPTTILHAALAAFPMVEVQMGEQVLLIQ
jgi:hypothetical protein